MTRWRAAATGAALIGATSVLAWVLTEAQNSLSGYVIRACCDVAAVFALGLTLTPHFDAPRYRRQLAADTTRPLVVCSAVWAIGELVRLVVVAAQTAGTSPLTLNVRTTLEFAGSTAAGHASLACLTAAVSVGVAAALPRSVVTEVAAVAFAGVGIAARGLIGHFAQSPVGGVVVASHALAAAVWCGSLAALAMTVRRRGQWARVLPRFATVGLICFVVVVTCGVAAAAMTLPEPAALYRTGHGRLLLAKVVVSGALAILAWRNRAGWLPAARTHRSTATVSRARSGAELAAMAIALTLAAALVVTG